MQTHPAFVRFFSCFLGLALLLGLMAPRPSAPAQAAPAPTYSIALSDLAGMTGAKAVLTAATTGARIKIAIEIKIGRQGIAEITDMHLSGTDLGSGRAHILAQAEVRGNRLYLKPIKLRTDHEDQIDYLSVRDQFLVPMNVSRKLGFNDTMILRRSRVELKPNSLLQFEIQM